MEVCRGMCNTARVLRLVTLVLGVVAVYKIWEYAAGGPEDVHKPVQMGVISAADRQNELVVPVEDTLRLHVYYEALCPDSKYLVRRQLSPALEKLGVRLDLQLVPYGKATTTSTANALKFECQHGPPECLANKIHACVIKKLGSQVQHLAVVDCMIEKNYHAREALRRCTKALAGTPLLAEIEQCSKTSEGDLLLKHMGVLTHSLEPPVSFIPTVTVNGSQDDQVLLRSDLFAGLCKKFNSKPSVCV